MKKVADILKENGPLPSSKIKEILMEFGVKDEAARQRISRTTGKVRRLNTLKLPNKEQFLFLDNQFASEAYWESLVQTHTNSNTAYGIAFQSLIGRGGISKENHFHILSGAPRKLTGHTGSLQVLERLLESKLLNRVDDAKLGKLILVDGQGYFDHQPIHIKRARLVCERIILQGLKDWIKNLGLGSYDRVETILDDIIPKFGQFDFDLVVPSYLYPLVVKNQSNVIPGFIVADVIYQSLEKVHIQYFLKKCKINRIAGKMRPFMGILISERFSIEAFKLGKQEGILLTTPETLFGQEIARSLEELIRTIENAAAFASSNPDKISHLFDSISKLEGAENNIRGLLFELIVGNIVREVEGNSIDIGVKVMTPDGERAEIDIRRVKGTFEVGIYECKSRPPKYEISEDEVKKWFTEKVPIIRKSLLEEQRFQNVNMIFEYWTTAIYAPDAIQFLKNLKNSVKKYTIDWKSGEEVLTEAKKSKIKSIINVLERHYLTDIWE